MTRKLISTPPGVTRHGHVGQGDIRRMDAGTPLRGSAAGRPHTPAGQPAARHRAAGQVRCGDGAAQPGRVRVWDALVRLFHWGLAAGFAVAFVVQDDWLPLHVGTGYFILALLVLRTLWGFVGPVHARWSDFVKTPSEIGVYLAAVMRARAPRYLGHNPAGGAMVVALVVSLAATVLSGVAVYGGQELSGPLAPVLDALPAGMAHALEDVHEVLANLTLALVVLHVAGVVWTGFQHRENLIAAMITGNKRSKA